MFSKFNIKVFTSGFILASILFSSAAAFGESIEKQILVVYNNIKIVVDGQTVTPKDANGNIIEPFVYNGTTYLPVRAISQALGKEVYYDANTNTIYLGKVSNQTSYLTDLIPYDINDFINSIFHTKSYSIDGNMTITKKQYTKGLQLQVAGYQTQKVNYNLDGKYKVITGLVGLDDTDNAFAFKESPVIVNFYADEKKIDTLQFNQGDFAKEILLEINGASKLTIETISERNNHPLIDFVDMKMQ